VPEWLSDQEQGAFFILSVRSVVFCLVEYESFSLIAGVYFIFSEVMRIMGKVL